MTTSPGPSLSALVAAVAPSATALVEAATLLPKHPAPFNDALLEVLRRRVPRGRVLDPFGGIGMLGRLGPDWQVTSLEIEPEWAIQGWRNGCIEVVVGDATRLPFPDGSWPTACTSPCYGNRLADMYAPADYAKADERRSHRTRRSYTLALGRPVAQGSAGKLQFGEDYMALHRTAAGEIWRVLTPGGPLVINLKDHIRDGLVVGVCAAWGLMLEAVGFLPSGGEVVPVRGDQNRSRDRSKGLPTVDIEHVLVFRKPT